MIEQFDGGNKKSESQFQDSGAAARPSAVWVKPTVERIALREALTSEATGFISDGSNNYS